MYVCMCVYDIIGEGVVCERGIVSICWCSLRDVLCVVCVVYVQCNAYVHGRGYPLWGEVTDKTTKGVGWTRLGWAGLDQQTRRPDWIGCCVCYSPLLCFILLPLPPPPLLSFPHITKESPTPPIRCTFL